MSTDLTPETLTEWRKEAGVGVCSDPRREFGRDHRILALLDALAAEKDAREEAEAKGDVNFTSAANTGYAFGVERDEWREKYEGARANMERLHQRVREAEARAVKAEQELKAERARNRLIVMPSDPESKAQMEQLLAHLTGENRRALAAAEARVAALEAELAGWRGNPMAQKYAALVAGSNALVDQYRITEAQDCACLVRDLRAHMERLERDEAAAMDLWWRATDDDWAVPNWAPGRFLAEVRRSLALSPTDPTDEQREAPQEPPC